VNHPEDRIDRRTPSVPTCNPNAHIWEAHVAAGRHRMTEANERRKNENGGPA